MNFFKMTTKTISSEKPHHDLQVGAINPYALVEALLGMKIEHMAQCDEMEQHEMHPAARMFREKMRERHQAILTPEKANIISDTLQCDYDELFDMKHDSVLYAGLKLNAKDNIAEPVSGRDMKSLTSEDLVTPDFSRIRKLADLHDVGMKDLGDTKVKSAVMENGNLHLILQPHNMGMRLSSCAVTHSMCELATPFRNGRGEWVPPNCEWEDISERVRQEITTFNIPVQGAVGNSYLIAALFAVAWSDPYMIVHAKRPTVGSEKKGKTTVAIKFHSKGGEKDASTSTVEVDCEVPVNKSSNQMVYCHSSGKGEIWPSLYEKAFAKWIARSNSEHPDITQTSYGDPVKAMAQINGKEMHYFYTHSRSADELISLIREHSFGFRTIFPMTAWTHATGEVYKGANIVANMAYTVLGFACPQGKKQYVVVRNPWGVTERAGLATYPGLLDQVDCTFWRPADMLDRGGVFALEANAFKEAFAGIGLAK